MKVIQRGHLKLWEFENLHREPSIRHFVTGRNTLGDAFTLSLSSSPDKRLVENNRKALAGAFNISPERLVFPSQIHKTRIVQVTPSTTKEEVADTDALVTTERGLCIAVMSADCVPILLYDKKNHAVAAVHAGWRGTVAKILMKTFEYMEKAFGTRGEDVVAGIGPSVCQDSYEVGEEVVNEFVSNFRRADDLMIHLPNKKAKLDLWKANRVQLEEFGVPASAIEVSDLCTVKNNDSFFSARKGDSGRFAAGIMLV
jgi:polyphenol oxidase